MAFEQKTNKASPAYNQKNAIQGKSNKDTTTPICDLKTIELIVYAMEDAYIKSEFLNGLSQKFSNRMDKEAIYNMYLDRLKHYKLLQEMYFGLAGRLPRKLTPCEPVYSPQLYEELERFFLDTKKSIQILKKLMFVFATISQRDIFFEIISDLESHLSEIAMLFTKYR